jgi:hypothetical protein
VIEFIHKRKKFKMLYAEWLYNDAWNYISEVKGMLDNIEIDFDKVMKDEGLEGA